MTVNQLSPEYSAYVLAHLIRDRDLYQRAHLKVREGDFIIPEHNLAWSEARKCHDEFSQLPSQEYLTVSLMHTTMLAERGEAGVQDFTARLFATSLEESDKAWPIIMAWLETNRRTQYMRTVTGSTPTSVLIENLQNIQASFGVMVDRQFLDPFSRFTGLTRMDVVPLGIRGFDSRIICGGVPKKRNVLLLSGTSGGKTTILTNVAVNCARNRLHSLFISLEDDEDELATRMYACAGQIPHGDLLFMEDRTVEINSRLADLQEPLEHFIHIYDVEKDFERHDSVLSQFTPDDLERVISDFIQSGRRLDIVLVDYLNLITSDATLPEADQAKDVTNRLKRIARKYNVVMVVTAQTNRTGLLKSVVDMSDMAGYFNASWGFDYILGFGSSEEELKSQRESEMRKRGEPEKPRRLVMNIAKGKMMAKSCFYVDADFSYMTLRDVN